VERDPQADDVGHARPVGGRDPQRAVGRDSDPDDARANELAKTLGDQVEQARKLDFGSEGGTDLRQRPRPPR
jgi:hypothetical protein